MPEVAWWLESGRDYIEGIERDYHARHPSDPGDCDHLRCDCIGDQHDETGTPVLRLFHCRDCGTTISRPINK